MNKYRIVIHAHSTWSYDGSWTVGDLANMLSSFGAHVLMMSEHSQRFDAANLGAYHEECRAASTDRIRVLPGIEYSTPKNAIHILTWGMSQYLGEELSVDAVLDAVEASNAISVFAHPSRREVWKKFNPAWAPKLYGMELWNRKSDGVARGPHAYDLIKKHQLSPIVSLDFHRKKQLYPLYNVLETKKDIFTLSDIGLLSLIKQSRLKPRFLGLPANGSDTLATRSTHGVCLGLQQIHRLMFRSR